MKLHVTCYFTIKQHKSNLNIYYNTVYVYRSIPERNAYICLLNDISIMHYVQFGSNISPDYVMPV